MLPRVLRLVAVAALFCVSCSRQVEPPASAGALSSSLTANPNHHLLVTLELSPRALRVTDAVVVEQPLPRLRVPEPHPWIVELRDGRGATTFATRIPAQNVLRGEFSDGGDGAIEATHTLLERAVFQVRVPTTPGELRLFETRGAEPVELGRAELSL